ncbi:hypothetical protein CC80DRAFT_312538 [Byssothecium circinans]|uniref:Uncharacterized protein n=1 Tax=Byssothecium circinans TaxID=147558 RepID=A0A6A5U7E3_9PLEO|nr:hypothetical protein CC80DRAFT_312538 [Byssothecium circinans]
MVLFIIFPSCVSLSSSLIVALSCLTFTLDVILKGGGSMDAIYCYTIHGGCAVSFNLFIILSFLTYCWTGKT